MLIGNGGHARVIRSFWDDKDELICAVGTNAYRKKEVEARGDHYQWGTAIHPSAIIAPNVPIGEGTVIMAGAIIQPGAVIGKHCIVNSGAVVDHDCLLHDFVHIAPHATLCGSVEVGEGAMVGAGAVCVQGAIVEPWALVKAGTVHKSESWKKNCKKRFEAGL